MKRLLLAAIMLSLAGCARFSVKQTDESPDKRIITTKLSGTAWFTSAQNITQLKAVQTDKTQSFGTASLNQQGDTNTVALIDSITKFLQALRP